MYAVFVGLPLSVYQCSKGCWKHGIVAVENSV